ncbi:MAG: hypothetical protein IJ852_02215 [Alphaproteobacteria bacterium]|nr:hypothetical protein [Alphaproteobacteria bacterium]
MKFLLYVMICFLWAFGACAKTDYAALVEVDVTAEDSVKAKEKAMTDAQRQAFLEVAARLTEAENIEKLNDLSDNEIAHFIRSVGVENEKAGGTKYTADLTVQIDGQLLKDYLIENQMIQSETVEMLVLPVFKSEYDAQPLLWENANDWRKNWLSKGLIKFGNMQLHTISDRYRNLYELSAENALYMGSGLYEQIAQMAGTDRIYVVYAQKLPNEDLKIIIKNEKNKSEDSFTIYNDQKNDIFDKAVEKSVMYISNMERQMKNAEKSISVGQINAVYIYQDMKDWLTKSTAMTELSMVEGIDTQSFGGGKVNFIIRYTGSLEALWQALQEIGLSYETAGNYFIIR